MNTRILHPTRHTLILAAFAFILVESAAAQTTGSPPPDQQQRREPPPQAYQDCKGKQAGDAVQITTPRGDKVSATCTNSPKGLFARPERPPCDESGKRGGN